jgi:hypothetical protein
MQIEPIGTGALLRIFDRRVVQALIASPMRRRSGYMV